MVNGAVAATADSGDAYDMSQLLAIIDAYKDAHGQPSDASIARAIGVAPQTISSWRKRGIREAPDVESLKRLAALVRLPYEDYVLQAALVDAGYRESMPTLDRERGTA